MNQTKSSNHQKYLLFFWCFFCILSQCATCRQSSAVDQSAIISYVERSGDKERPVLLSRNRYPRSNQQAGPQDVNLGLLPLGCFQDTKTRARFKSVCGKKAAQWLEFNTGVWSSPFTGGLCCWLQLTSPVLFLQGENLSEKQKNSIYQSVIHSGS